MSRARDTAGIIQYNQISFDSNNAVGIGSSIPDTKLDVNGGMRVTGIVTASSFVGDITGTASDASGASGDFSIADKIVHTGDTNTAIRFPAADTFTVETGGSEAYRVDSSQRLLLGLTDATTGSGSNANLQIEHATNGPQIYINNRNSTINSDAAIGEIKFHGKQGGNYSEFARILVNADGTTGDGDAPGRLVFQTTADGASSPTERLRITSAGDFGYGTDNPGCFFEISKDDAGATVQQKLLNRSTSANSSSNNFIYVNGAAAGDPFTTWTVGGVTSWSMGIDNSDSDKLVINNGSNLSSNLISIDTSGNVTLNANLDLQDSDKILLGTGDDLQIYHNGSNSFIEDKGTGILALTTNGTGIHFMNDAQDEFLAKFQKDGEVILYQDNSARVTTTADGVDIGGTGSIKVPVGTTAQRNSSPTAGDFRYNSETGGFEGYTTEWGAIAGGGGGITSAFSSPSGITTHVFLSDAQEHKFTCSGITTISCAGGVEGESHTIRIINSGITTVGFSTFFLFPSGAAPNLPTADGAISLISFTVNRVGAAGTQLLAGASVNFS